MIDTKQPCPRCRRVWPAGHFASLCRDVVVEQRNEAEQALEMERAAHRATAAQRDQEAWKFDCEEKTLAVCRQQLADAKARYWQAEQDAIIARVERDEVLRHVETLRGLRQMDAEVLTQRDEAWRLLRLAEHDAVSDESGLLCLTPDTYRQIEALVDGLGLPTDVGEEAE